MFDRFCIDLTGHEVLRRGLMAHVGAQDDEAAQRAAETLLYSGLDEEQERTLEMLKTEGVL